MEELLRQRAAELSQLAATLRTGLAHAEAMIPKHRHRYHGVFAPNHRLRKTVTALAIGNVGKRRDAATGGHAGDGHGTGACCDAHHKPRSHDTSRIAWAKLMARVGEEFPFACPNCGGDILHIAFITEPGAVRKILTHLGEPLDPPPLSPTRGPPADWGEIVQVHDDRDVFQATDRRSARDRYSEPLSDAGRDPRMSGNYELRRGLRRREKNATEGGAGRFEKPAPDARAAPPEAHESLIGRKTVAEVPLTGLSLGVGTRARFSVRGVRCTRRGVAGARTGLSSGGGGILHRYRSSAPRGESRVSARDRMRRRELPLLEIGARPRSIARRDHHRPRLEDSSHLVHRVVPEPTGRRRAASEGTEVARLIPASDVCTDGNRRRLGIS